MTMSGTKSSRCFRLSVHRVLTRLPSPQICGRNGLAARNAMGDCRRKQLNMGVSSVLAHQCYIILNSFLGSFFLNRMSFQVFRTAAQLTTRCDVFSNCTLRSVYACALHETFTAYLIFECLLFDRKV